MNRNPKLFSRATHMYDADLQKKNKGGDDDIDALLAEIEGKTAPATGIDFKVRQQKAYNMLPNFYAML